MSYQLKVDPIQAKRARFIGDVIEEIVKALEEESKGPRRLNRSKVAAARGVHRAVVTRELQGYGNLTLGTVADYATILGREILFSFCKNAELAKHKLSNGEDTKAALISISQRGGVAPSVLDPSDMTSSTQRPHISTGSANLAVTV